MVTVMHVVNPLSVVIVVNPLSVVIVLKLCTSFFKALNDSFICHAHLLKKKKDTIDESLTYGHRIPTSMRDLLCHEVCCKR